MTKRMLIDGVHPEEMRVAIADEKQIFDFDFITAAKKQVKGNIYLAKITRVEPSLQAAFVEYGGGKQGFLPFAEIHADYYQIPVSDRRRLMEEAVRDEELSPEAESAPPAEESSAPAPEEAVEEASLSLAALPDSISEPTEETPQPAPEAEAQPAEAKTAFVSSEIVAGAAVENAEPFQALAEDPPKPETEEGVETLASEEEEISDRRKRQGFFRRYKIQEVIKRGQIVLVQVIKEERGNKGVSLTTYLSLPGRYCVLMPNSPKDGGVSRKISDGETRKRLKELMAELKLANGMSVIIRTAGMDRTRAEIRRDFDYLVKLWNRIREDTLSATAPALIYEESDLIKRAIRDQYTSDIDEVVVEGDAAYKSARDFMKMLLPSHTARVKHYNENMPLFYAYGIEDQLLAMNDPVVKLRSGGYLVLNPTEALISIDVNSGRATGERNIEETATKTNLEAAAEVARQLRLRDLAGLIVIDFIDMMESRNRRAVERALKDALKSDRAKIQLGRISPFGLLEMSRQRLRPSIAETNNITCPHCNGRGQIRSPESMSIQIIRALEKEAATGNWGALKLNAPEESALYLLNTKRTMLNGIEDRHGVSLIIAIDHGLTASAYTIEKTRRAGGREGREREERESGRRGRFRDREARQENATEEAEIAAASPEEAEAASPAEEKSSRNRRGRRGGRGRRRGGYREEREEREENAAPAEASSPEAETPPEGNAAPAPEAERERPRQRGGRGRRRWRESDDGNQMTDDGKATAESLPAFTRAPVEMEAKPEPAPESRQPELVVSHPPVPESSARPEGSPPRKGWWQRIIELD